ncbi:hypothetical protein VNI00_000101 [Paramarasmius palmivorus]|uniref:GTP binding protein 2 n=1 Tax=Paramarasmius palmivorus TaxID=297713 RepID=A0AAW0EDR3_9AGAR
MFGEDESESPRVPSPWDSLMSTPASSSPYSRPVLSSSPLAASSIPKLVPESDDGNVEYKLQLLNPSPSRFARLVTQLKWRLLEGGGQAYYELGVADSGALVGLSRIDLESSLETLEMMAGEIGASVIVVKEIEVPAAMAKIAAEQEDYRYGRKRRESGSGIGSEASGEGTTTATETETDPSTTDVDGDDDTFFVQHTNKPSAFQVKELENLDPHAIFSMDPEPDPADNADEELEADDIIAHNAPQFLVDLEISSVFKPRPVRTKAHLHPPFPASKRGNKGPKPKKLKNQDHNSIVESGEAKKSHNRRAARDKRREEKRKALLAVAENSLGVASAPDLLSTRDAPETNANAGADALFLGLETLHVSVEEPSVPGLANDDSIPAISLTSEPSPTASNFAEDLGEDDVFASPTPSLPYKTFQSGSSAEPHTPLSEGTEGLLSAPLNGGTKSGGEEVRLIVEALVVRKMSLEEAFLDFEGFSLT